MHAISGEALKKHLTFLGKKEKWKMIKILTLGFENLIDNFNLQTRATTNKKMKQALNRLEVFKIVQLELTIFKPLFVF